MIKACAKRLVVIELEDQEQPHSFLIVPKKKEQVRAQIVAMGTEVDQNLDIDDVVFLPADTGIELEIDGERYLSIAENQILAALKEEECLQ